MIRRTFLAVGAGSVPIASAAALTVDTPLDGLLGPTRGEGDPVAVEPTVDDERVEYLEATDEVRFPTAMAGDRVIERATESFEWFAKWEAASAGNDAVTAAVERRTEPADNFGGGVTGDGSDPVVSVTFYPPKTGDAAGGPSVGFGEPVAATPRAVRATVTPASAERTFQGALPVVVERASRPVPL